jgi:hypothetical protein
VPCDIGYRSVSRARIDEPVPETFESRTEPPEVDAQLLERLGVEDPVFLDWLRDLDSGPLLEQALERALAAVGRPPGVEVAIRNGRLAARATTAGAASRARVERAVGALSRRWQMEVLRVVAELLDYEVTLATAREDGRDVLVLSGEKRGDSDVRAYLRVTALARGEVQVRFEHWASEGELEAEAVRFSGLAQRLGVRVAFVESRRGGQAIPPGAIHRHGGGRGGRGGHGGEGEGAGGRA